MSVYATCALSGAALYTSAGPTQFSRHGTERTDIGWAEAAGRRIHPGAGSQAVLNDRLCFGVPPVLRASVPTAGPGAMPGTDSVFQAPQEGGPGQHGAVPVADTPTAAGAGTPQLCRGDGGSPAGAGWSAQGTPRGAIIAAQEAPPSPVSLRNGHQPPAVSPVAPIGVNHWDERWTAHLAPLVSSQEPEADQPDCTDGEVAAAPPATVAPRKPTFLQRERWKAVQKARRKGMSLRAIERELGIHRSTVRSYLEAGGPPGWKQRMVPNPSTSDTMAA